jgi:bacterioferritin
VHSKRGDPTVIEYLNKGLRSEPTAINQYWLHYRFLDNWSYKALAKKWREEFDCDLPSEMTARALYEEAATYCHSVKDYVSRDLFEELMHDEEEHIDFLETQLDLVPKLGLELYAQHHIGKPSD